MTKPTTLEDAIAQRLRGEMLTLDNAFAMLVECVEELTRLRTSLARIDKFVDAVAPGKPTKELASIQHEARSQLAPWRIYMEPDKVQRR